jgi:hypothetical protein
MFLYYGSSYTVNQPKSRHSRQGSHLSAKSSKDENANDNPLMKGLFVAAEVFGKLSTPSSARSTSSGQSNQPGEKLLSLNQLSEILKEEYLRVFWATGSLS